MEGQVSALSAVTLPSGTPTEPMSRTARLHRWNDPRLTSTPVIAGLPALLTLLVAGIGLGGRQLWRDEHASWWAAMLSYPDLIELLRSRDVVFAPYYGGLHLWTAVFGDSAPALRLPSLLWMASAAALVALLGRRLYGAPTGLTAGLLFALLPIVSRYAAEARPYAQVIALTTASSLLLLRALERPSRLRWVAYALAVAATGLSHLVALTVLVAHAVPVLRETRRLPHREVLRRAAPWAAATGAGLVVVAPMAYLGSRQSGQISWIDEPTWAGVLKLPANLAGSVAVAAVLLVLALIGVTAGRWPALLLGAWVLTGPLLALATFDQFQLFFFRYLLYTVPAWVLLAAAGTLRVARAVGGGRAPARAAAVAVVLITVAVLGLPRQQMFRSDLVEDEHGFRDAGAFVAAQAAPGDGIVFDGYRHLRRAMAYELRDADPRPVDVLLAQPAQERGSYAAAECRKPAECLGDVRRVWLVTTQGGTDPLRRVDGARGAALRDRFVVARVAQFHRIRVVELVASR